MGMDVKELARRFEELPDGSGQVIADGLTSWYRVAWERGLERLPFRFGSEVVGLTVEADLGKQAERYVDRDFHTALGMAAGALRDQIMALVPPDSQNITEFIDRGKFNVPVVLFGGIPLDTQYRLAGIDTPDNYNWHGSKPYIPPGGFENGSVNFARMQDGSAYLNKAITQVQQGLAEGEILASVNHGVGLLMARPDVLAHHRIYLSGTQAVEEDGTHDYEIVAMLAAGNRDGSRPALTMYTVGQFDTMRRKDFTTQARSGSATLRKS